MPTSHFFPSKKTEILSLCFTSEEYQTRRYGKPYAAQKNVSRETGDPSSGLSLSFQANILCTPGCVEQSSSSLLGVVAAKTLKLDFW
jgi:hypothetical protein